MFLVPGETGGTETYARELVRALGEERTDLRLTAFVNRETAADPDAFWGVEVEAVTLPVNCRNRLEWVRGEQLLLPRAASRHGCTLLHSLANTGPISGELPRVLTVHDLLYRAVPDSHFGIRGLGMRVLVPAAARRSDRIIAISSATAAEVNEVLGVSPERIDVVHNGLGTMRHGKPTPEAELRERLGLGSRPILLSVSTKRAHKNLPRVLDALASMPSERRPILVLPGYPTPHEVELREQAQHLGIADDVCFAGWLPDADLEGLYDASTLFLYASLYEGFGLPVLEAMSRELPVACSDIPVLREVAGEAAAMFDPLSSSSIADVIQRVMGDEPEQERLIAAGLERAAGFSWADTARGVAASYEAACGRGPRRPATASR